MSNKQGGSEPVIQLPQGGGAISGMGEKFSPDLFSGTGNFSVPIGVPAGRNGMQPTLAVGYSTGMGNGPFGLGWALGIPGVRRKTDRGIPVYDDAKDVFVLSGAEDLVPVVGGPAGAQQYRPRTEGLFAEILHFRDVDNDYWRVRTKEGLTSWYGTPNAAGVDEAVIADPSDRSKVFSWMLTRTEDLFGNHVLYSYVRDAVNVDGPHHWDQCYLDKIRYADYEGLSQTEYLCSVEFLYEDRPDPFSSYGSGFETRTLKRCKEIQSWTHPDGVATHSKSYLFRYLDERVADQELSGTLLPANGVSLLSTVQLKGVDGLETEYMPPVEFGYSVYDLAYRDLKPIEGDLPSSSLASPGIELLDLFGRGLPDFVQMDGTVARYWRNLGEGRFDVPRNFEEMPLGLSLADPNVQLMDADGDGRTDLFVSRPGLTGYFPMGWDGGWERRSFQKHALAPSFSFTDPEVRMIDLNGDGMTDVLRSGARLECFFNDREQGFQRVTTVPRESVPDLGGLKFSDPRVRFGSMTGGLQDIVLIHKGRIDYWPNLGHGRWGAKTTMRNSPLLPEGYNPQRLMMADLDGDGCADLLYVEDNSVTVWMNHQGEGWGEAFTIKGTPRVTDLAGMRVADLMGDGVPGLIWTRDKGISSEQQMLYLRLNAGAKPYLMVETQNNLGAMTRIAYASSVRYRLVDDARPLTRWRTPLPFPVLVVAHTEALDLISGGKLVTEYNYHHGYWDGEEREFRGFGRVDQRDTETFARYHSQGLFPGQNPQAVEYVHYSPPMESKTWFHLGPVGDGEGDWIEADYASEYWEGDENVLQRPTLIRSLLSRMTRRERRDALRTLRGTALRSEVYALDGTALQSRPYTVGETLTGVARLLVIDDAGTIRTELSYDGSHGSGTVIESGLHRIFLPYGLGSRSSAWERGTEPMTNIALTGEYDQRGYACRSVAVAVPHSRANTWRQADLGATESYLATVSTSQFVHAEDGGRYLLGRGYEAKSYEAVNDGTMAALAFAWALMDSGWGGVLTLQGWSRTYYDDEAYWDGTTPTIPLGELGQYGIPVMSESLVMDSDQLTLAYGVDVPDYLLTGSPTWPSEYPSAFQTWVGSLPDRLGYTVETVGLVDYYFVRGYTQFDFMDSGIADPRGMVLAQKDALGNTSTIGYDDYLLMPVEAEDALGNTVSAEIDYRLLAPWRVTEPNGNRAQAVFTPLGLVQKTLALGKIGETIGDTVADPGSLFEYDLFAYMNSGEPVWARNTVREQHAEGPYGADDSTLVSIAYSDGFGRVLQSRAQAEEVTFGNAAFGDAGLPASQLDPNADAVGTENTSTLAPNVIVSGWKTYDNKGRVVESWEPYYDTGWNFVAPTVGQTGQKMVQFYDAAGRVWRSVNPDGTESRMVFGTLTDVSTPWIWAPSPWQRWIYDANDLAPLTHPGGGHNVPSYHFWTPRSEHVDALGRVVVTVDRNHDGAGASEVEMHYFFDIRGNWVKVDDALKVAGASRPSAFEHVYDYANRPLQSTHIDKGASVVVFGASGLPIEGRDAKGSLTVSAHDALLRPTDMWARDVSAETATLRHHLVYGESKPGPTATNHIGRLWKSYDEAGMEEVTAYDFKGNPLEKRRRVVKDSEIMAVFAGPPVNWAVQAWRMDWTGLPGRESILETHEHVTAMVYDGLGRPMEVTLPEDANGTAHVLEPSYNRAGAMESVELDGDTYIGRIAYNARGQRLLVAYGNGIMTRHAYDPVNFRLLRQRSEEYAHPVGQPLTYEYQSGSVKQDCEYTYDLSGNIVGMVDASPSAGLGGTGTLGRDFGYDALYRLLSATGRESGAYAVSGTPWNEVHVPDQTVGGTVGYTRTYTYDLLGNMLRLRHAGGSTWDRWYNDADTLGDDAYETANTLGKVKYGATTVTQSYDAVGNLVLEGTTRHLEWDAADRLRAFYDQGGTSEPTVYAHYLYDAGGNRVKKVVRKSTGNTEVTVYVDGVFEYIYQLDGFGAVAEECNEVHVMDGRSRVARLKYFGPTWTDVPLDPVLYNLEDHLGNALFTLDGSGGGMVREEYFPFGETSFGSYLKKRYRFCGKERDEESGFYYYGARYYAAWCCRFVSVDPLAGEYVFYTPYQYAGNQPMIAIDLDGLEPTNNNGTQKGIQKQTSGMSSADSTASHKAWKGEQKSDTARYNTRFRTEEDFDKTYNEKTYDGTIKKSTSAAGNKKMIEIRDSPMDTAPDSIYIVPNRWKKIRIENTSADSVAPPPLPTDSVVPPPPLPPTDSIIPPPEEIPKPKPEPEPEPEPELFHLPVKVRFVGNTDQFEDSLEVAEELGKIYKTYLYLKPKNLQDNDVYFVILGETKAHRNNPDIPIKIRDWDKIRGGSAKMLMQARADAIKSMLLKFGVKESNIISIPGGGSSDLSGSIKAVTNTYIKTHYPGYAKQMGIN